jgi:hypothetical protein
LNFRSARRLYFAVVFAIFLLTVVVSVYARPGDGGGPDSLVRLIPH